jgi:inosine-uridine nucleoside N-ribohydrolase
VTRPAIVLDCDPGIDDAMAILTAARYSDLVAITTVNGNVSLAKTTRNALVVAELAGLDVPVHRGSAEPLVPHVVDAAHVHGDTGLGAGVDLDVTRDIAGDDAVGYLVDTARARDDIHLVAVGPLTNVALAIRRDPSFASRLRSLTIMGGSASGGNVTAAAEFNIYVDPEAAAIVFGCGIAIRTIPLDLTRHVVARTAHVDQLAAAGTPTADFVAGLLAHYGRVAGDPRVPGPGALHDPCAVLSVTNPELFGLVPRRVDIELDGRHTRGMTVVDSRPRVAPEDHNAHFGYTVDAPRVLRMITDAAIDPRARP